MILRKLFGTLNCGVARVTALGAGLGLVLGCGDAGQGESGASSGAEDVYAASFAVATASNLPKCTSALYGTTAIVGSPVGLFSCVGGSWVPIQCSKASGGAVAYASATNTLLACVAGTWTQVPLSGGPAGPAGPAGATGPAGPAGADGHDGTDGVDGVDGQDGADGASTLALAENIPAGGECARGGLKVMTGIDGNADGQLAPSEVTSTAVLCNSEQQPLSCGDGVINAAADEECDDGNSVDGDGCLNSCRVAFCGDGVMWTAHEQCDDGNSSDNDLCLSSCRAARCGDGFIGPGEECDDGNLVSSDSCSVSCVLQVDPPPAVGSVVITEIMFDPNGAEVDNEWFELTNVSAELQFLGGCSVQDRAGGTYTIPGGFSIEPGLSITFASGDLPGTVPSLSYGGAFSLNNTGDMLTLLCDSAIIDQVSYVSGVLVAGKSLSLDPSHLSTTDNDDASNWCYPDSEVYDALGNHGTPSAPNPQCP
jgi:cysteine-rich repeat protein